MPIDEINGVICPHCNKEQDDIINGKGPAGPWGDISSEREGVINIRCDGCGKEIKLTVWWEPVTTWFPFFESEKL